MSTITHLSSLSDLASVLEKNGDKLTVIDFHATWCGPCHAIAPKYESLSKQYTNVKFTKCDVDDVPDVAQKYDIRAMPSFVFLKNGQKVDLVRGANPSGLESAIKKHSSGASGATFSGKGQTLGGVTPTSSTPAHDGANKSEWLAAWDELDPQMKILGLLVAGYFAYVFVFA